VIQPYTKHVVNATSSQFGKHLWQVTSKSFKMYWEDTIWDRQTDTKMDRHTDGQTHRWTDNLSKNNMSLSLHWRH